VPSELSGRVHSPPQRIRPSVCDNGLSMPFSDHVDRLSSSTSHVVPDETELRSLKCDVGNRPSISGAGMAVGPGGLA